MASHHHRPVEFLIIEKETLGHHACTLYGLAPYEHGCSMDVWGRPGCVVLATVSFSKADGMIAQCHLRELGIAGILDFAVAIEKTNLGTYDGYGFILVHAFKQWNKLREIYLSVVVDKEEVLTICLTYAEIVASGKTEILVASYYTHPRVA